MAQIIDTSSTKGNAWLGQVQWNKYMNRDLIEPMSSLIMDVLQQKGWNGRYEHVAGADRQTYYFINHPSDAIYPEKPREDFEGAVRDANGEILMFEPDADVKTN